MPLIHTALYDGQKPVSFVLNDDDAQRFQAFMQRYRELQNASYALVKAHPETIATLYLDGEPVGQQFLELTVANQMLRRTR